MIYEEPKLTEKQKKVNAMNVYMDKIDRTVTKRELCTCLYGWEYNSSNERRVRRLMSLLAKKVGIIGLSNGKGYNKATKVDQEVVKHQLAEIYSRIKELRERAIPLEELLNEGETL